MRNNTLLILLVAMVAMQQVAAAETNATITYPAELTQCPAPNQLSLLST